MGCASNILYLLWIQIHDWLCFLTFFCFTKISIASLVLVFQQKISLCLDIDILWEEIPDLLLLCNNKFKFLFQSVGEGHWGLVPLIPQQQVKSSYRCINVKIPTFVLCHPPRPWNFCRPSRGQVLMDVLIFQMTVLDL